MSPGVTVHPHEQVVLVRSHLHDHIQIPALEIRIEEQLLRIDCRVHAREDPVFDCSINRCFFLFLAVGELVFAQFDRIVEKGFSHPRLILLPAVAFYRLQVRTMARAQIQHSVGSFLPELRVLADHGVCWLVGEA